jgi:acyl carrier protein
MLRRKGDRRRPARVCRHAGIGALPWGATLARQRQPYAVNRLHENLGRSPAFPAIDATAVGHRVDDGVIYGRLSELLGDVLDDDDVVLAPETTARDVAGWDSLANVRFMLAVEQAFKVRFAAAESAHLKNVGELVALIRAKS